MACTHSPAQEEEGGEDEEQQQPRQQQPDVLFLRSSFVGDLFFDPCFFFTGLPKGHASKTRTRQTPQQIPIVSLVREAEGQPVRAPGAAKGQVSLADRQTKRPTRLGRAGEPVLTSSQVVTDQAGPSCIPDSRFDPATERHIHQSKGKRKAAAQGPQREDKAGQHKARRRAELGDLSEETAGLEGVDPPQQAPRDSEPPSMLRNIDIRQSITNHSELRLVHRLLTPTT